jgi:hypothetical protein
MSNKSLAAAVHKPIQKAPPSPGPWHVPGWYFRSGYLIQPGDHRTYVGRTQLLAPEVGENRISGSETWNWYYSIDGINWQNISNITNDDKTAKYSLSNGGQYLRISSKKAQTIYFQQTCQVYPETLKWHGRDMLNPLLYSDVSKVQFSDSPHNTLNNKLSVSITNMDEFLYLDDDFSDLDYYPTASITPDNSDDFELRWTSSDSSIAQVNPDTGKVTINKNHKSGSFDLKVEVLDPGNLKTMGSATKTINVGYLLTIGTDEIKENEPLQFFIHGPLANQIFVTEWHQIKDGKDNIITPSLDLISTILTKPVSKDDDNSYIYAKITDPRDPEFNSFTSNKIQIRFSNDKSQVHIDNFISSSYPQSIEDSTSLSLVAPGDKLTHILSITDNSKNVSNPAELKIPISENEKLDAITIKVNGNTIKDNSLSTDQKDRTITIKNIRPPLNKLFTIEVTTLIDSVNSESTFEYNPTYKLKTNTGTSYYPQINSTIATFLPNTINLHVNEQNHISYGTINLVPNKIIGRINPSEKEDIVSVSDTRRSKTPVHIQLTFSRFLDSNNPKYSPPMNFKYFDKNGTELHINENKFDFPCTKQNDPLESIKWKMSEGLKLFIKKPNILPGHYKSNLTWTISESC